MADLRRGGGGGAAAVSAARKCVRTRGLGGARRLIREVVRRVRGAMQTSVAVGRGGSKRVEGTRKIETESLRAERVTFD